MSLAKVVEKELGKSIAQCSNEEIYFTLLNMVKEMAAEKVSNQGKKKLLIQKLCLKKMKNYI